MRHWNKKYLPRHGNAGGNAGSYNNKLHWSVEKNLDEVTCMDCGHMGLTSHGHCRQCFAGHKLVIE